jgi:hypothetical protein
MSSHTPSQGTVALAVPPQFRPGADSWSRFPLRALAYGHYVAESTSGLPLPSAARAGINALSLIYIASASIDRSRRAEQFQLHPELRQYMARRAAVESLAREWVGCVTLPAIAAGAIVAGVNAALARRAPGSVSPALLKYGAAGVALAASPLVLSSAAVVADRFVLDWAIRPVLDDWMAPPGEFDARVGALRCGWHRLVVVPACCLCPLFRQRVHHT